MFSTDNGMNSLQRLILAVLLVLVMFGFAGHLSTSANTLYHATPESTCALHAGFLAPVLLSFFLVLARDLSIITLNISQALRVLAKIPPPPTI